MQFQFGDYTLDVDRRELWLGPKPMTIAPQVFDLLVYLVESRNRVVSKDDLIESVWDGRIVSDSTLTSRINAARTAIGDTGKDQRLIKTIARKGFRFVGDVREIRSGADEISGNKAPTASSVEAEAARCPIDRSSTEERPCVVVLPFRNVSGDPEQEYFADGLTEDITTALALWHSFPIIARNSAFAYKGKSIDIRQVGEELGARYIVEGSVRRSLEKLRVTVQISDAERGHQIWANRYDEDANDVFAVQDEITSRIVSIVDPAITQSEYKRIALKPPTNLDAWDLCIQGYHLIYQGTKETNAQARTAFEQAIDLDPSYAKAWTGLSYTYGREFRMRYSENRAEAARKCLEMARQAVKLDNTNGDARLMMARGYHMTESPKNALLEMEHAVKLNPYSSGACWSYGAFLYFYGRAQDSLTWFEKALELNPLDPRNYIVNAHFAAANLCVGDFERAADLARAASAQRPDYIDARITLAAALGHLGRNDEAREAVGEFKDQAQKWAEDHPMRSWRENVKIHYLAGLTKAGLMG